jgi:hypothetical protein
MPAGVSQYVIEAERLDFRHPPRSHILTTDAVLELPFALQH